MGEKGNALQNPVGLVAAAVEPSLVERITTTTTSTMVGVGQDFLETVKDKAVGAVADVTVTSARDRMARRDAPPEGSTEHGDPAPSEQSEPDEPPGTAQDHDSSN